MITKFDKETRMITLIKILNEAAHAYYSPRENEEPILSDSRYDQYLKELEGLEKETGIKLFGSPTMKVGFSETEEDKIKHYAPVLSLKDTKSIDEILHFLGEKEGILSWKLDGVSIVLYYVNGTLQQALSRGDGHYGKDITKNVLLMKSVPMEIPVKSRIIVRGEGCIALNEFDQIKKTKEGEKYTNPRSMVSGLVNGTRTTNILLRHMRYIAHSAILLEGAARAFDTRSKQLDYLGTLAFSIVPYTKVLNFELKREVERYTREIESFGFPVDGLVLALNDIKYGESLGATAKYPKHSMAFKWPDETTLTKVTGMKWSVSKTGLITPVVLFEPVSLDGTTVKQANLHTLKIFEELEIGVGDILKVFKANKIIPQVEDNLTRSNTAPLPSHCPMCGSPTLIFANNKTRKLYCETCNERRS